MAIKERLTELINALYSNIEDFPKRMNAFSRSIDAPESTTRSYVDRGSKPSVDYLEKVARAIVNINTEWLLTGEGDMFKTPENKLQEYTKPTDKRVDEQEVPLYDFEAAAGLTKLFSNAENILDFIRVPNLPKCDGAVHISGDSMYPLLKSGDIVMYKQVQDIRGSILWGEMYLLSAEIGGDLLTLVKYIQRSEEGKEYVKLVSQNQYHSPIDIPLKNIRALALIKASIRINSMA